VTTKNYFVYIATKLRNEVLLAMTKGGGYNGIMPLLPMAFRSVLKSLIVNGKWLIVSLLLTFLFTIHFSLFTSSAHAQEEPVSLPCQNPIVPNEEILTHHWLANENREPPANLHRIRLTVISPPTDNYHAKIPISIPIDFSELGALFGPTNSNYNEGKYQNIDHKQENIAGADQVTISTFNGPGQKAGPQVMLDLQRIKYVNYVWENSHLPEASDEITDTNGENPRRIYDMVVDFGGLPDTDPGSESPTPPSFGGDKDEWQEGWGKYWGKIPTTYDEFYEAYIAFREESNSTGRHIQRVLDREYCPDWLPQEITFVVPRYFRTTTTTGQLNQIIVPKVAQSHNSNDLILGNKDGAFLDQFRSSNGILGKIIDTCLKAFKNNPISNALKNVISSTLDLIKPIPDAFAQSNQSDPPDPNDCIRVLIDGKEGQDPYCAFPTQLNDGLEYTCENQIDQYKLDTDNENVICTFQIYWEPKHNPMKIPDVGRGEKQWDECHIVDPTIPLWSCSVDVSIWPVFKIPWTTEIWNNTLFSDVKNNEPFIGSEDFQIKGRPGTYSFFTPITIFEEKIEELLRKCRPEVDPDSNSCNEIINILGSSERIAELGLYGDYTQIEFCITNYLLDKPRLVTCLEQFLSSVEKKKPGETDLNSDNDLSRRFIGGSDCSKEYVWHNALYPIAAQQVYGIKNACPVETAAASDTRIPPDLPPGFDSDTLDFYIKYGDTSIVVDPNIRTEITNMANNSWPGNNIDQWDFVVSESLARGISPAFTITIWWEEGGFGGAGANSEFGCFPGGDTSQVVSFSDSLNCFLNFTANEHPYDPVNPQDSFIEWVAFFCGPNAVPLCSNNPGFLSRLKSVYNTVAPGEIEFTSGNI